MALVRLMMVLGRPMDAPVPEVLPLTAVLVVVAPVAEVS